MTALPFLDKMRNIISNKRVLIAAIAVTLILVTLAAVIVTLYYSSQDDSGEAIEKAKRLLEEFEEQRRLREEKEAAEKAAREFHMTVAIGSAFFNVLIAIAAIQLAKFGNIKVQPIVQLALVLACVLLQQGAFLLLLAISVAIYEICRVFLTSPNRVAKVFVSLICTVASMVAFCCAILCLPVLLLAMTFRYGKLNLGAFFVNLAESVKGAVVYSFGGDPLPEFSPSSNFRW